MSSTRSTASASKVLTSSPLKGTRRLSPSRTKAGSSNQVLPPLRVQRYVGPMWQAPARKWRFHRRSQGKFSAEVRSSAEELAVTRSAALPCYAYPAADEVFPSSSPPSPRGDRRSTNASTSRERMSRAADGSWSARSRLRQARVRCAPRSRPPAGQEVRFLAPTTVLVEQDHHHEVALPCWPVRSRRVPLPPARRAARVVRKLGDRDDIVFAASPAPTSRFKIRAPCRRGAALRVPTMSS